MDFSFSNTLVIHPFKFWELDSSKNFKDADSENKFYRWMQFLNENSDWLKQEQTIAKKCFALLDQTKISSQKVSEIYQDFIKRYPDLFPESIKLKINEEFLIITKNKLSENSEKFKKLLSKEWLETQKNEIPFTFIDFEFCKQNPNAVSSFLSYLQTGYTEINGENVLDLYVFAKYHYNESLANSCLRFIIDNLSKDNVIDILETACPAYQDLVWACLIFLCEDLELERIEKICEKTNKKFSQEISDYLNLAIGLVMLRISPSFSKEMQKIIEITRLSDIKDGDKFLRELNKKIPINGLKIETYSSLGSLLSETLPAIFPHISFLSICTEDKELPSVWTDSLLEIECGNINLTHLNVPNAEKVSCLDRETNLESLNAPNAKVIICSSQFLTNLHALKAQVIDCYNCKALKNITAPEAETINCSNCESLTHLYAPKAEIVNCSGCYSLIHLDAPNAKEIICSSQVLMILNAPKAKTIDCSHCKSLKDINAPEAKTIDCSHCESLIHLHAPKAETIKSFNCYSLIQLNAPEAKTIDCSHCESLIQLNIPEAITINSSHCYSLIQLNALEAKTIKINWCTSLTHLHAPKAETIECYCKSLIQLNLPEAKTIDCSHCESLIRLCAPKVETIKYFGCYSLINLNAPNAKTIIGSKLNF